VTREEMMKERGLSVDHATIFRWVQRYAPEINRRMRPHLKMSGTSSRIDETYVKVGTSWKYLYRAVDSSGDTIEFMLSAKRDISAAKRFFKKMMRADHRRLPFTVGTDKHASYPEAFASSVKEKILPADCKAAASEISQQRHRAGSQIRQKAMAGTCSASARFTQRSARWKVLQLYR
jgi:IS6 family transposase